MADPIIPNTQHGTVCVLVIISHTRRICVKFAHVQITYGNSLCLEPTRDNNIFKSDYREYVTITMNTLLNGVPVKRELRVENSRLIYARNCVFRSLTNGPTIMCRNAAGNTYDTGIETGFDEFVPLYAKWNVLD